MEIRSTTLGVDQSVLGWWERRERRANSNRAGRSFGSICRNSGYRRACDPLLQRAGTQEPARSGTESSPGQQAS